MKCLYYIIGIVVLLVISTKASEEEMEMFDDVTSENDDGGDGIVPEEIADATPVSTSAQPLCNINMAALTALIQSTVEAKYAMQPAVRLFQLSVDSKRKLSIYSIVGASIGKPLDSITIGNGAQPSTGSLLAYRPKYYGLHKTGLGAIFVNLDKLYPCAKGAQPVCGTFSFEEDGFVKGKAIVEAGDIGNNFRIFSAKSNIRTYGLVFQGCPILNGHSGCLPTWYQNVVACYLPRKCL